MPGPQEVMLQNGQVQRTVVVVGSGGVIRDACVRRFVADGARVTVIGSEATPRTIDPGSEYYRADLASEAEIAGVAEALSTRSSGVVDILVTVHMELTWGSVAESSVEEWERALRINVLGPVVCAKAFLPALRRSGSGAIVHLGSIDGALGNPSVPAYSVSKGAINTLTHVMAEEFGQWGIRVNCVARAAVVDPSVSQSMRQVAQQTPLRRVANPDEIANVVAFLTSDEASFVNGVVLPVDGGRSGLTPGTIAPP